MSVPGPWLCTFCTASSAATPKRCGNRSIVFASHLQLIRPTLWSGHPAWLLGRGGVAAAWLVARIWPSAAIANPSQLVKRGIAYQKKGRPLKALAVWKLAGDRGSADAFYR